MKISPLLLAGAAIIGLAFLSKRSSANSINQVPNPMGPTLIPGGQLTLADYAPAALENVTIVPSWGTPDAIQPRSQPTVQHPFSISGSGAPASQIAVLNSYRSGLGTRWASGAQLSANDWDALRVFRSSSQFRAAGGSWSGGAAGGTLPAGWVALW